MQAVRPLLEEEWEPKGHAEQAAAEALKNVPAEQVRQADMPGAELEPAAQATGAVRPVELQ